MSLTKSLLQNMTRRNGLSGLNAGLAAGVGLAASAAWNYRSGRRAEQYYPPAGRFIEAEGVRLHYIERGAGQPVVLLHGNGANADDFIGSGMIDELARRYHVIAFDRPGFGYSQRPRRRVWTPQEQAQVLISALSQLNVQRPAVLAHSFGTGVALAMALRHQDAFRGLILVSGYYYPTLRLDSPVQAPPAIPILGDVLRYTIAPFLARLSTPLQVRYLFSPQPVPQAFWRHVPLEMMVRPWQLRAGAAESALMVPATAILARHYEEIRLPVTIIAGTEDRMADCGRHSARLHDELPQSRLLLLPGLGHMLHYAVPQQLAAAVDALHQQSESGSPLPSTILQRHAV